MKESIKMLVMSFSVPFWEQERELAFKRWVDSGYKNVIAKDDYERYRSFIINYNAIARSIK